jgi:hypothetical protein
MWVPGYETTYQENKMEDSIASDRIQIERKEFYFDLKENQRGILLRITEEVRGHRDTIIVPATGLREFSEVLNKMIDVIEHEGLDPSDPTADEEDDYEDDDLPHDDDDEGDDDDEPYDDEDDAY